MSVYYFHGRNFKENCQRFFLILHTFSRQNELQRLVKWAHQKQLSRPLRLYQNRLADEHKRLICYRINSPRLTALAHLTYRINTFIFPAPHYLPKGSAKVYRTGWLTNSKKSHSILRIVS